MLKWTIASFIFVIASESSSLIDAALKGESLTDRGVWIGLLSVIMFLVIWFAKNRFSNEDKLTERLQSTYETSTERLEKIAQECAKATRENMMAVKELQMTMESMRQDMKNIDNHQQAAAKAADDRDRRRRGDL